jgi:vesicle coat complex subunit
MFKDAHPRVRYAACQCLGQLCTDSKEVIQDHRQLFAALIPTLEAPEPRVHAHAAVALINFCEGVERDALLPYLDPIVERFLKLLNPGAESGKVVKGYVQEQAITTLAMVADAREVTFAKHYGTIMPLLLNVLRDANDSSHHKLRVKAMECAGLIAIAVGCDIF